MHAHVLHLALHAVHAKWRRSAHVHACMLPVAYTYMHFFAIAKLRARPAISAVAS
jgi:hypothetical protein